MYTLRKVSQELGTSNEFLGKFYHQVNRFENPERFREYFKKVFRKDHIADLDDSSDIDTKSVIGFIITSTDSITPIRDSESNYIMTEGGNTFDRLNRSMIRQKVSKRK